MLLSGRDRDGLACWLATVQLACNLYSALCLPGTDNGEAPEPHSFAALQEWIEHHDRLPLNNDTADKTEKQMALHLYRWKRDKSELTDGQAHTLSGWLEARSLRKDHFSALQEWIDQHRRLPLKYSTDKLERQSGQRLYRWEKALHAHRSKLTDEQASTLTAWLGDVSLKDGAEARRRQIRAEQAIAGRAAMADEGLKRKCAESGKAVMQDDRKKRACAASGAAAMQDADKRRA